MVVHDGVHPLEEAAASLGDADDVVHGKIGVLEGILNLLDLAIADGVLVELHEGLEELHVRHHRFGRLPGELLPETLEHVHALADLAHEVVWVRVGADLRDVVFVEVLEGLRSLLKRWNGSLKCLLSLGLLHCDLLGLHLELLLALGCLRLFGLSLGGVFGYHLEHLLDLLGLDVDLGLGHFELLRHDVHLLGGLNKLLQAPVEACHLTVDLLALLLETALVVGDEVEVVLGGHIVEALELQLVIL
mmetsp:Transcript_4337/g.12591  ORF Transcript_4337/g.12591 Transcript_4337/m.12591 type:complete len:246 (+) Transcript_4337:2568-3305(+)